MIKQIDYKYGTEPYAHQHDIFMESRDEPYWAILADPGTGKSKITIDTAAWQYMHGKINLLLIIAPNNVHRKWIRKEIPTHLPDYIEHRSIFWISKNTKKILRERESIFDPTFDGLRVVSMNIDAVRTAKGKDYLRRLLNTFDVFMAIDESTRIKTPGRKRTLACINFGKHATSKRILTGTLITKGPMDAYAQFKFLDPNILGFATFTEFKNHYGVWRTEFKWNHAKQRMEEYPVLEEYRNLEELNRKIMRYSSTAYKDECLDLPPKVYDKIFVELSPEQRRVYDDLRDEFIAEFEDKLIDAPHALTRLLRLQQVVGGYYDGQELPGNCKLKALLDYLEDRAEKVIIWAKFKDEIRGIERALKKIYGQESTVTYYGDIDNDTREANIIDFQTNSDVKFFVGTPASGGIGLDLFKGCVVIYYSNDYNLETRLQSEDRAHRIGQQNTVLYIDMEADNTLDGVIIDALRQKKNIADIITGSNPTEWI